MKNQMRTMKLLRTLMLTGILSMTFVGIASATPVTYEITNLVQTGTGLAAFGVTTLSSSTAGAGDITISGGQIVSGSGSGADWVMNIDISAILAGQFVDVAYTDQDLFAISSTAGNVTANGETVNTTCAGPGSGLLCGSVATGANIAWTWPTPDDAFGNPETATIANFVGTDTNFSFDVFVYSNNDLGANGTVEVTQTWHFQAAPEPSTGMLLCGGLIGMAMLRRRGRT